MKNPFMEYGESHRGPIRRKPFVVQSEKEAPMVLRGAAKAVAEDSAQYRRYRQHLAREREALLKGQFGHVVDAIKDFLKTMTPDSAPGLFDLLEDSNWLQAFDEGSRYVMLSMIDDAIIRMRVQHGLPPIDDSLPGEEPTVFEICRGHINRERT
jgi:hypothetical protein